MSLMRPECPYCAGESGGKDYFGEWSECECCNHDGRNETGHVWFWQLWQYQFRLWRIDRQIERQARREGW